jgi:hypothetical protein
LWAALGVLGGFGLAAIGDMVSEEIRDRLDHLPHAILRLAARRLDSDERAAIYDDEWLPELTYILKGDESRPVTRLYHGIRFALGILAAVRRITAELSRPSPLTAALARIGAALTEVKLLVATISAMELELDLATKRLRLLRSRRGATFARAFEQTRLQWQIRATKNGLAELYARRGQVELNVIEAKMADSLGELMVKLEGTGAPEDWAYVEREVGRRSKNRHIRRVSRS